MSSTLSAPLVSIAAAPLSALVLAHADETTLVEKILGSHGFVVACAPTAMAAEKLCAHQRFDLAVYDEDVQGALELAVASRIPSQPRVVIGLTRTCNPIQLPGMRLHFVLQKPFTGQLLARTVTATYGSIAAERKAGFRLPVNIAASECIMLHGSKLRSLSDVRIVNLSHTGLCLEAAEMLPQGAIIEVSFTPPQSQFQVELVGTVMWTHASGRAGIKFNQPAPEQHGKFGDWLDSVLPNAMCLCHI